MNQQELTELFCSRPQNFAWFLGAGASRASGLPTANDVIWDMKRRHYCAQENQEISRQDIQNQAVRTTIQSYMESKGFPENLAAEEYSKYFEKIFGDDHDRQRKYLKAILSEEKVTLSIGNRVLGALLSSDLCRIAFTTNFDTVVEKSVAEVSGKSISAFHIEGAHAINSAFNNEEFPIYSKLHGDFRYESIKNLSESLSTQNEELSKCLVNAGNRFGFVVAGYSGRDASVMKLFRSVLDSPNPFPHGLFWTGLKGFEAPKAVAELLDAAKKKGVSAHFVPIETYDSFMLRLWRNIDEKPAGLISKVQKSSYSSVNIPLPPVGARKPIMRMNALPLGNLPRKCTKLNFSSSVDRDTILERCRENSHAILVTRQSPYYCWGTKDGIEKAFDGLAVGIEVAEVPTDLNLLDNLNLKGFFEEALCKALSKDRPLLSRSTRSGSWLIADTKSIDSSGLDPLFNIVGKESGELKNLVAPITENAPNPQNVSWAEALKISIESRDQGLWMIVEPDIWVWPPRARRIATDFLDQRKSDRFNKSYNALLSAWVAILFDSVANGNVLSVSPNNHEDAESNPVFEIHRRTAYSMRIQS